MGLGWSAVSANLGAAHGLAVGSIVRAAQANTEAAKQFIQDQVFFRIARAIANHGLLITLAWVLPLAIQSRIVARARARREAVRPASAN